MVSPREQGDVLMPDGLTDEHVELDASRCPSCGLLVPDAPHATETACVKALRAELERLIAAVPLDPQNE